MTDFEVDTAAAVADGGAGAGAGCLYLLVP